LSTWYFLYPKRFAFYPGDYEDPGLGGSEGSLVVLARALARAGHQVSVFNCCYKPGVYEGVTWRHEWEIDEAPAPDVLVSVRIEEAVRSHLKAQSRLYWMLDDRTHGAVTFAREFGSSGGRIVVASKAMRNALALCGLVEPVVEIPLPVELDARAEALPRKQACLYCSAPNRGLDALLALWPSVRACLAGAELWVTGGYQMWGYTNEEASERYRSVVGEAHELEGVTLFGVVPRQTLALLRASCMLMTYPCRFHEMFCLSAAECTVAGVPIVASDIAALSERVINGRTGYLIAGDIARPEVQHEFVSRIVSLLGHPRVVERMSRVARGSAAHYSPQQVASRWSSLLV
jgi:glycosyltransferase involved in cell wall biosynthesis